MAGMHKRPLVDADDIKVTWLKRPGETKNAVNKRELHELVVIEVGDDVFLLSGETETVIEVAGGDYTLDGDPGKTFSRRWLFHPDDEDVVVEEVVAAE